MNIARAYGRLLFGRFFAFVLLGSMAVLAFGVAVTVSLGACGHAGPSRRDVLPEAYLVYPGAKEVDRSGRPSPKGLTRIATVLDPIREGGPFDVVDPSQ